MRWWAAAIVTLGGVDWWFGKHDLPTASQDMRAIFHTDHPAGRAAFTCALLAGAIWLHRHITQDLG